MIRTPLYSRLTAPRIRQRQEEAIQRADDAAGAPPVQAREAARDTYLEKIVKYVPAEVLGVFVALAASSAVVGRELVAVVFVAGLVATPLYFYVRSAPLPKEDKPRLYFYVLSMIAFVVWAFGASESARELAGLDARVSEVLLGLGALLIPLVDELLTIVFGPTEADQPGVEEIRTPGTA